MVCSLMKEVERLKEERNNESSAAANTHASVDEIMRQGHQMKNFAQRDEIGSSQCDPDSSESRGRASEQVGQSEEDEGSVMTKLRKMVSTPLIHMPSLALGNPVFGEGIMRRPYENGVEDGRDPSPDRTDSDSISAYEDASAETPEQDRMFLGDADTELPHDSENKEESSTNNCQATDSDTQDPKNESCVVS